LKRDEDRLHQAGYVAIKRLVPADAVVTSWESRGVGQMEGARRRARGVSSGWPDMSIWYRKTIVLIEWKTDTGRVSPNQAEMHARLAHNGFPVAVCRSLDDAIAAVQAAGIPTRGRIAA